MKDLEPSRAVPRRGTGPRTVAGKKRSRFNAVKHGGYSRYLILEGEDRSDFEKLHRDLRADIRPKGARLDDLVEYLAIQMWRRRRCVAAETAIISRSAAFVGMHGRSRFELPHQGVLQALPPNNHLLFSAKGILLESASKQLSELSAAIKTRGFDFVEDIGSFYCTYGLDDGSVGQARNILTLLHKGLIMQETNNDSDILKTLISEITKLIDAEASRLLLLAADENSKDVLNSSRACLIPAQSELDAMVRWESHKSREIEKTLVQIERIQREQRVAKSLDIDGVSGAQNKLGP
jgi:hypothetical protein